MRYIHDMTLDVVSPIFRGGCAPTVVGVPCFSGAPWDFRALHGLDGFPQRTMRLPETLSDIDLYADFLAAQVRDLDSYILAGDSFGAVISLALAARRPTGLVGLVLSGGFAADPLPSWKGTAAKLSKFARGPLYRQAVLRFHAFQLASAFDSSAEVPHTQNNFRSLFVENTPRASYTARVTSVVDFDMLDQLSRVVAPTLLITPADDRLIGTQAAQQMLTGIPRASEVILPATGHMFRFTHPTLYSNTIRAFVESLEPEAETTETSRQ